MKKLILIAAGAFLALGALIGGVALMFWLENIEEHYERLDRVPSHRTFPPFLPSDATDITYNNQLDYADWRWRFHFESVTWIEQLTPMPLHRDDCVPTYRKDERCDVPAHIKTYCFVWRGERREFDIATSVAIDVQTNTAFAWIRWPRSNVCD